MKVRLDLTEKEAKCIKEILLFLDNIQIVCSENRINLFNLMIKIREQIREQKSQNFSNKIIILDRK